MKICVCVKQVPDSDATLTPRPDGVGIVETGITFELNPYDRYALEEALKIKDADGSEVVAVGLGPARAAQALKTCLATGADRAIHLADAAFLDGDPWSNATALAAAIRPENADLVLCGLLADDDNQTQTPVILAERLDMPHATGVMQLEVTDGALRVEREMEGDRREVVDLPLPAVVSTQTGINEPRYASIKGIMAAKKKELRVVAPADLGLDPGSVGQAGAKIRFVDLSVPAKTSECEFVSGSVSEIAADLVKRIHENTGVI
ncbi:MAG: electron transfer flavoprotein subunit beta/FixA family protein [Acidobacteriota bacterium]